MTFDQPWFLAILVPALAVVWSLARWGRPNVAPRQHRWAVVVRTMAVVALVLAIAGADLRLPSSQRSVVYLLDRSDSITARERSAQDDFVTEALDAASADLSSGVVVFGAAPAVDRSMGTDRIYDPPTAVVDGSATNIATAMETAAAIMPTEGSRRVVILTDSVETMGDAGQTATDMAANGVVFDVVNTDAGVPADAAVESVDVPAVSREGETIAGEVVLRSSISGPARVTVTIDEGETITLDTEVTVGANKIPFTVTPQGTGVKVVSARLALEGDTREVNDEAAGTTRVLGPGRVAVVRDDPAQAEALVRALEAAGIGAVPTAAIPDEDELIGYDGVVLVNVAAPTDGEAERLRRYVEDLGRGLLVVGGDSSYGMGDYADSGLEAMLPVSSNPDDLLRRQPIAEVIAIDTSGSMGACHCADAGFRHMPGAEEGGVNKTDLSRAGAALAIETLTSEDQVGVVAFGSGTDWVLPLGPVPGGDTVTTALGGLTPEGNTEIAVGLGAARDALAEVDNDIKHIILFTDGWDPNEAGLLPLAEEIASQGITLSVLGTGEGSGATLERMAELGGGRFFRGTDLATIPEIFIEETQIAADNLIQEGSFFPALRDRSPLTTGLTTSPSLSGYVATRAKGPATVPLEIGEGDPLLATWRRGLGTVIAWTSDASTRWSAQWVGWDGYVSFWGRLVSDILPDEGALPVITGIEDGSLIVEVPGDAVSTADLTARVAHPDGSLELVPLRPDDGNIFAGSTPVRTRGTHHVTVEADDGSGVVATGSSGIVTSYSPEYALTEPDQALASVISAETGGVVDPEPAATLEATETRGASQVPLWPWLTAAALVLFLVDVALRRLDLRGGSETLGAMSSSRPGVPLTQPPPPPPPPPAPADESPSGETMGRLLRRKRG